MKTCILIVSFFLFSFQSFSQTQLNGDYPQASSGLLDDKELMALSGDALKIMRNEIFARYGYIFKNPELKKHFESQSWYTPLKEDVTNQLTEIEKSNITLIRKWEDRIAKTADFDDFFKVFKKAWIDGDIEKLTGLVNYQFYKTPDEFINSYEIHENEIRKQLGAGSYPKQRSADEKQLSFGEFYEGIQYKSVHFQKIGCCWYIYAIVSAG